jgi:outer membrane protein TolC
MRKFIMSAMFALFIIAGASALSLDQCVEMAKQNNKDLLSAKEDINIADQLYYDVRGMLLPQVSVAGAYTLTKTWLPDSSIPASMDFTNSLSASASSDDSTLAGIITGFANSLVPSSPMKEGSFAAQLKLEQILFSGGKLINGINAVNRYRSIQSLRYNLQEQDVIAKTTEMFYQTLLAKKVSEIQQESLDIASKHYAQVELLNKEGQVSEYDLLRARLEVEKLRPNVVQARDMYELATAALRKQIGSPNVDVTFEGDFILPETQQEDLATAQTLAEKQRIELKLSNINTEIMKIKYKAEKGNYLPNVALIAGYSVFTAADEFAIQSKDFGTSANVGIGFSIPIFTGFSNTAKRSYAKHGFYQAQIKETDAQEYINLEIKQDWQNLHFALETYQVQLDNITLAERSLELAQVRYENQVGIQLEVFDAQIMLSSIKLSYYNSIFDVINANQKLKKAMGFSL